PEFVSRTKPPKISSPMTTRDTRSWTGIVARIGAGRGGVSRSMPGMYTSPDEARSDLFLAGAVYVFGGIVIALLLDILPLQRIPGVDIGLALVLPIVTTALVPH